MKLQSPFRRDKNAPPWSYNFLGSRIDKLLPLFNDFRNDYNKARRKRYFRAHIAYMLFNTLMVSVVSFILTLTMGLIIASSAPLLVLGVSGLVGIIAAALTAIVFLVSVPVTAGSRGQAMDLYLPYALSYMSILANAGIPPHRIFASLADARLIKGISDECRDVVRDISLLGRNMTETLKGASQRSPSRAWSEFLDGYLYTIRAGGDQKQYLLTEAKDQMRAHRTKLRSLTDTLTTWGEAYVTILVAFPLIITVMLGVMMVLGGNLGFTDPLTLLRMITYVFMPAMGLLIIVILSAVVPEG